jgi:hypothetical protein
MAILSKGTDFSTGDQVTAANLDALVDSATFASGAVDNTTTALDSSSPQKIIVKDLGIGTNQLANSSSPSTGVTTAKIADNAVTLAKMATQADQTVLGNVSGGTAVPTAVPIVGAAGILVNNDSLGTDDTKGATQGNIKAFVENLIGTADKSGTGLVTEGTQGSITLGGGLIIKFGSVDSSSSSVSLTFKDSSGSNSPFPNAIYGVMVSCNENIGSGAEQVGASSVTVSGCNILGYSSGSGTNVGRVFFIAIGH